MKSFREIYIEDVSDIEMKKIRKSHMHFLKTILKNRNGIKIGKSESLYKIIIEPKEKVSNASAANQFLMNLCNELSNSKIKEPDTGKIIIFSYKPISGREFPDCIEAYFSDGIMISISTKFFTKKEVKKVKERVKVARGSTNERTLYNAVKVITHVKEGEKEVVVPVNIEFTSKNGMPSKLVQNVVDCEDTSKDTSDNKKADVVLITKDNERIPISIKKDNAVFWESSDTNLGKFAKDIFERLDLMGEIAYNKNNYYKFNKKKKKIEQKGYIWNIGDEIQVQIEDNNIIEIVCFGSDVIKGNGVVVQKTFGETPLILKTDASEVPTYTCPVSYMASSIEEVKNSKKHAPYLLIRNDSQRGNTTMGYRGIRVVVHMGMRDGATTIKMKDIPQLNVLKKELLRYMSENCEKTFKEIFNEK